MSDNQFDARAWQNGELCTAHGLPYCTPCFKSIVAKTEHSAMDTLREKIIQRILEGERQTQSFYRPPQRNFFQDSRRKQLAASCEVGEHHLVIPLSFVMIGNDKQAWNASDDEAREVLRNEHRWDCATPAWAQNFVPDFSYEDQALLREMQLFQ